MIKHRIINRPDPPPTFYNGKNKWFKVGLLITIFPFMFAIEVAGVSLGYIWYYYEYIMRLINDGNGSTHCSIW